jgi:lysyl-tRNA synthetase, class II
MREDILNERRKKRTELERQGHSTYPARVKRTIQVAGVLKDFKTLSIKKKKLWLTGRVVSLRKQGGLLFLHLEDASGKIQCLLKRDTTKDFPVFKANLDIGDFIEVAGVAFRTKAGEKSVEVKNIRVIAKSLRPIPSEFYGLKDIETRLRKRYLDFLVNPEERDLFVKKAKFWKSMRTFLEQADFLEVHTPVLEVIPGGAEAEPFVTHHNALDEDFYLRISLELPLKRLMVSGFEGVYEIGHVFRNEGISAEHLQDYLQMEVYWAYHDYNDMMKFIEKMYKSVVKATTSKLITEYNGKKLDWGKKWKIYDYKTVFMRNAGLDPTRATKDELFQKARELGAKQADAKMSRGRLLDIVFKNAVRAKLIQPGFLIDPPVDIEPLAKRKEGDEVRVERFQVIAGGTELGKGFSELNDPTDQRTRFEAQMKLRAAGDKEAQMLDEDYVEAMEYGMPPMAGFGLSERLFAVLMDRPIRETTIFPLMRKK